MCYLCSAFVLKNTKIQYNRTTRQVMSFARKVHWTLRLSQITL
ncbi:hypothetical protein HMPREF1583_01379 [Gardnerella vaginalis JCP8151B]|nr:hypothetical protein HMPREF1583_01379 [Gardnerella vaginalis JCP8151B]